MDIATLWDPVAERGDWVIENGDLKMDGGLTTAAIISLGTDRLANADDELPLNDTNRRGWWGDTQVDPSVSPASVALTGARFWLPAIMRGKAVPTTLRLAVAMAYEATNWMIETGVAASINVAGRLAGAPADRIELGISIAQRSRTGAAQPAYSLPWSITLAGPAVPLPSPALEAIGDEAGNPLFDENGTPLFAQ